MQESAVVQLRRSAGRSPCYGKPFHPVGHAGMGDSANQNRCPLITLAPAFSGMNVRQGLGDFHELMLDFHRGGCRCGAFDTLNAPRVTETEAVMLALWSGVVAGRQERANAVLALLVPQSPVGRLYCRMDRVAERMAAMGNAPAGLAAWDQAAANSAPRT